MQALLALEDGRIFHGRPFGRSDDAGGEVVFVTAMSGYQEVLTDPSYHGQIVVFTSPHIGNYGIHEGHGEAGRPWATGIIVRDLCETPAHPESVSSLRQFVRAHQLCGLTDVDTRALTLHLREKGTLRGFVTTHVEDHEEAVARAREIPPMRERALVEEVTTSTAYTLPGLDGGSPPRVCVLDFGVKRSILEQLRSLGCAVTVLPAFATPDELDASQPGGVVLSNGPGDPEQLLAALPTVRRAIDRYPTLAICLGHQLAGLALGSRIRKLSFGHHGSNHPVQDLRTGVVAVTAQNHNYAIDADRLPPEVEVTHVNLNDGTVEGFVHRARRLWSFQFHPEGAPGPHESRVAFGDFVAALLAADRRKS